MPPRHSKSYSSFKSMCSRYKNTPLKCPLCCEPLTFGQFDAHVRERHGVCPKTSCVYCFGKYTWENGKIRDEAVNRHRLNCLKKFKKPKKRREPQLEVPLDPPPPEDPTRLCVRCREHLIEGKTRNMGGRVVMEEWEGWYDDFGIPLRLEQSPNHVSFTEESGLGDRIHPIIQKFEATRETHDWFHIMVRAKVWPKFREEMPQDVHFLEYWCLCDGMKPQDPAHRVPELIQHRHMIIMVEKSSRFNRVWTTKINLENNVKGKLKIPILTLMHLVNCLMYVSNPKARCKGVDGIRSGDAHFWMSHEMYPHARIAMATLFRGGLKEYLTRIIVKRLPIDWYQLVEEFWVNRHRHYRVAIKHLGIDIRGCVLPLTRDLQPSRILEENEEPLGKFLWLYDQILLLESKDPPDDRHYDDWCLDQMARGNCFLNVIDNSNYELHKNHNSTIKCMNEVKRHYQVILEERDRIHELEMRNKNQVLENSELEKMTLERDMEGLKSRLRDVELRHARELESLKSQLRDEKELRHACARKLESLERQLRDAELRHARELESQLRDEKELRHAAERKVEEEQRQNQKLQRQNQELQISHLTEENRRLKEENRRLLERLTEQISHLTEENRRLREQISHLTERMSHVTKENRRLTKENRRLKQHKQC